MIKESKRRTPRSITCKNQNWEKVKMLAEMGERSVSSVIDALLESMKPEEVNHDNKDTATEEVTIMA